MPEHAESLFVGWAGWSIARNNADDFPASGTHLERYARRLPAVEINSSFYRPHRRATYERWAASTPPGFRFAVKVPRTITHYHRLAPDSLPLLEAFLDEVAGLGARCGPLLVQLPPSLGCDHAVAAGWFEQLRERFGGLVVCEPRHASWFTPAADRLLERARVSRVAADPAPVPEAAQPRTWGGVAYYRLHGSPVMYESAYSAAFVEALEHDLFQHAQTTPAWCIFDNTALGAAIGNALQVWRDWQAETARLTEV